MRSSSILIACLFLTFNYASAAESTHVTEVHRLSDQSMDLDNPSWSPDKKWIAVSNIRSDKAEADELWLISTGGGGKRKLLGANELESYGSDGYSIWDIKWVGNDKISFVLPDNAVDSFLITLPVKSPAKFKETARDLLPEAVQTMPAELKEYLVHYYHNDSDQKIDLDENPQFFHFNRFGKKWYVQHLRNRELLIVDILGKSHSTLSLSLPSDQIGDNLRFESIGNKVLAIYPVAQSNEFIVDHIVQAKKVVQLIRITGDPYFFSSRADSAIYVYTRSELGHPFKQLKLYRLVDTLEQITTQDWHNLAFSQDGKSIAFIKIENKKRILYVGNVNFPTRHSSRRAPR